MNVTDFLIVLFAFGVLPLVGGYALGYRAGRKRGEADAWLDHYFAEVERNRARRQRNGQFKSTKGITT